ncbi:MAG: aquaporin, partial [Fibrobacteraceae bacterium]|nr:aquaporin [Fibrobacteraceae bacterium]
MKNLCKKSAAELFGTFVLVFAACGTAALTGCVDAGGLVATALAFGLVIVAMAYSIGRVSGCHINPAVSLACLLTKRMSVKEFIV